jgi:hypothetical protein
MLTTLDLLVKVEQTLKEMSELLLLAQTDLFQGIRMEALRARHQSENERRNNAKDSGTSSKPTPSKGKE